MNYPGRVIKSGEANKTIVKAVQEKLNEAGCGPLEVLGVFGAKTVNAIKLFQATHRDQNGLPLEIDGKVGSLTWAALFGPDTIPVITETTSPLLEEALKVAKSQIGVMEDPPGSNRGAKVEEYLASVDLGPGNFWCAAFLYWCFKQASITLGRNNPVLKTGHCMTHWNNSKAKKILASQAVSDPSVLKPGQLFIINTGGTHGHTGIIEKIEGGFIHTIEGNTDPAGSSNGIGVFRNTRKIAKINRGFLEYK